MAGFPTRHSRAAFGPTPSNKYPTRNPAKEGDAATFDLVFAMVAAASGALPLAWAILDWDGATLTLGSAFESWDQSASIVPIVARSAAGIYTLTYDATYPDKDAVSIATNLRGAIVVPQTTSDLRAVGSISSNRIVDVRVRDSAGAAADSDVLVVVF